MELTYRAEPRIDQGVIVIQEFTKDPLVDFEIGVRGVREQFAAQVIDTRDRFIREALVKLGWTPPPERSPHEAPISETRLRVRANDPCTSIEAAERAAKFAGSHQERMLRALGDLELSTHQMATRCGLTVVQVDRRICELERLGRIEVVMENDEPLDRCGYLVYRRIRTPKS